ncbi:MAG: hypothetical protein ACI8PQ_000049 [Planctomycetota bacterium]
MPKQRLKTLSTRLLLSVLLAAGLLGALMAWGGVSPQEVVRTIVGLPPGAYAMALGLHVTTYCLRALRFRILIPAKWRPGFRQTFFISSAHNMASYVLPAKMGEAAFPLYMRIRCRVPSSVGLATLLVSRFLDAAMMCTGLAAACLVLRASGRFPGLEWLGLVGLLLSFGSVFFVSLSLRGDLLFRLLSWCLRWIRLHHWSHGEKFLGKLNTLSHALRISADRGRIWLALLCTVPLWFTIFGFYTVLARAMGLSGDISLLEAGFGAGLAGAFNLLPVNGFAGVGTQEFGWVTGFNQFLGYDYDLALGVGIGVHMIQLFNIVAMGLLAHFAMGLMPRRALAELESKEAEDLEHEGVADSDAPELASSAANTGSIPGANPAAKS